MLWVGGGIVLHGLEELGMHAPADLAHRAQSVVEAAAGGAAGVAGWVAYAAVSAIAGLALGGVLLAVLHRLPRFGKSRA